MKAFSPSLFRSSLSVFLCYLFYYYYNDINGRRLRHPSPLRMARNLRARSDRSGPAVAVHHDPAFDYYRHHPLAAAYLEHLPHLLGRRKDVLIADFKTFFCVFLTGRSRVRSGVLAVDDDFFTHDLPPLFLKPPEKIPPCPALSGHINTSSVIFTRPIFKKTGRQDAATGAFPPPVYRRNSRSCRPSTGAIPGCTRSVRT